VEGELRVRPEVWELYDMASTHPARLEELKALFASEAEANHVDP